MGFNVAREVAHVDDLIDRVERCLADARAHKNTILIDINTTKLRELEQLRDVLIPKQREPEDG